MACEHTHLRCTDCRLFCMDCGIELQMNDLPKPEEKPVKTAKNGSKRKAKKEDK